MFIQFVACELQSDKMCVKSILLIFTILVTNTVGFDPDTFDVRQMLDYVEYHPKKTAQVVDIRKNFMEQKDHKRKIINFDTLISNDTVYADNISHFEIGDPPKMKKANQLEEDFKNLLMMKTMKYIYKRDNHWRTWREIENRRGEKEVICYKCQSVVHPNCTDCVGRGLWVIEDAVPPCPYEILSVINNNQVCAAKVTELNKPINFCPLIMKTNDLTSTCENPIVTHWRFTRNYKVPKRTPGAICNGREYCEVLTIYQIFPDQIIFRIVQGNKIIYSRVMKDGKKNFACVGNCGIIDLDTFNVTRGEDSDRTVIDLNNKKKRDKGHKKGHKPKKPVRVMVVNIKPKSYTFPIAGRKFLRKKLRYKPTAEETHISTNTECTTKHCKKILMNQEDELEYPFEEFDSYEDLEENYKAEVV